MIAAGSELLRRRRGKSRDKNRWDVQHQGKVGSAGGERKRKREKKKMTRGHLGASIFMLYEINICSAFAAHGGEGAALKSQQYSASVVQRSRK